MRVIEHPFSDLLREPKAVVRDLDEGDVLLRRRGAPALRLTRADRDDQRADAYALVGRALRNLAVHSPGALADALLDEFPWTSFLPKPDQAAFVDEFTMADGRRIYLIGEGRLVNLAAAEGHPALVMDMSFANQALAAEWVIANAATLERKVYDVPKDIDDEIARLKLATMGITIDELTEEQARYLASWDEGT